MDKYKINLDVYVILCGLALLQTSVYGKNSYIFLSPSVARPGRDYVIQGEILDETYGSSTITAELSNNAGKIASEQVTVQSRKEIQLNIPVPTGIPQDSKNRDLTLTLRGEGGLTFKETKPVTLEPKSISTFIQTDKAVYKPGQTVRFRVFGVTPDLKIVFDKLKVEIHDANGNKINQWDISGSEMTRLGGVFVMHQLMSEAPVLGKWKIKARLLSHSTDFEEKTFEVDKYVLPKFETELDLPSFGRTDVPDFKGKIKATYTFGKPVKGIADLRIKPKNERFQWIDNRRQSVSKIIEMQMPINGETEFTIPMKRLEEVQRFLSGSSLIFEANVTEDLTKYKQGDEQELSFYDQPIKLSFPKSLPETFKPGMKYDAVVIVAQRDDTPPDIINGKLKVTITEYRRTAFGRQISDKPSPRFTGDSLSSFRRWWRPSPPRPRETIKVLDPVFHTIPADGIVVFPIEADKSVTKMTVKAEYSKASMTKTLKKRHSPSNTYLQMRLLTDKPKAGQTVDVDVRSTERPGELNYQIYSRGSIVQSGTIPMSSLRHKWTFTATAAMAPRTKIILFFVRSDGEVIADGLTFNVEGAFENQVNVQFSKSSAAPADKISLDITADAGSDVHVLGVDKSVLLMATGNDITESQVMRELQGYDIKTGRRSSHSPVCDWFCWRWPIPVGGEDVKDVFEDAGVIVITDALVYEHREPPIEPIEPPIFWHRRRFGTRGSGGPMALALPGMAMDNERMVAPPSPDLSMVEIAPVAPKDMAPVQRTRKLFPETWLWRSETVQPNGSVAIQETVPDTITSWIASAFAVHPNTGLGVAAPTPQLPVTLPLFVTVNLPYSVIRGEKVIIQVNIHNYSPQPLFTMVKLEKNNDFENIILDGTGAQNTSSVDQSSTMTIGVDEVRAVYFPIIPKKIGLVDVKVQVQSSLMADAIHKKLLVEAEGSPREYNLPVLVDLKQTGTLTKTVNVEYPLRTVSGSERVRATVIGDLMGPSIDGLDKLIKLPTGCGEQNMLKFSPNIFVIKYLESTNNLDKVILDKAKGFMETGYQKELTYAHPDGSFSAFGTRDKSGSTWLTAFVLKSFVQAKPYIFVDDNVINKAVDFLLIQQNANGTFGEPGRVLHKDMQGGSTSGMTSLTAYTLISLLESRLVQGVADKIAMAQIKAQTYLEGEIPNLTDVYDLAIVAYALQLSGSAHAQRVWELLDAKAKIEAGTKYWQKVTKTTTDAKPWEKRNGVAIDIELTSYALLTLAAKKDRTDGVQVLKWVTEQRNPNGGFSSTQDTVIALQGLAEMAALIYSPRHDITVNIEGTGFSELLMVNDLNAQVLQSRDLPSNVGAVTITATGTGLALVQIEVSYNIDDDDQKQSFDLTVTLPRESVNDYDVKVCARWLAQGSSSMAVMEIGSPSGFVADIVSIFSEPTHKRADIETRKLVMYFDEIGAKDTCTTVTVHRVGLVAGAQPVPVRIFDYYEPTNQVTSFYIPEVLRRSEVCEICGTECSICAKP